MTVLTKSVTGTPQRITKPVVVLLPIAYWYRMANFQVERKLRYGAGKDRQKVDNVVVH